MAITPCETAQPAHLAWVTISPFLASVRLKGARVNLTAIVTYTPTIHAEEEEAKEFFYNRQSTIGNVPP